MKAEGVDTRKTAMVEPDDFVGLEIPTFYHLSQAHQGLGGLQRDLKRHTLSSPHKKRHRWRGDTARPRTVEI
jgi:hypothetical protein